MSASEPPAMVRKAFAEVLTAQLEQQPLKRGQFAARARISRPHLYKLARGLRQPTLTVFVAIAQALGMCPPELMRLTMAQLPPTTSSPPQHPEDSP